MANCCRSPRCSCIVTAGDGITVEGNGSSTAPYVISGQGAAGQTAFQVTDTDTVDLTLTGDGSAGAPFQVSAAVKLDPTPPGGGNNLIQTGPEGLSLECADVRGCFSAGDGAGYDPATGVITARVSTDPGNGTAIGTDGGLFTPATSPALPAVGCGLTGDGTAGAPITANPVAGQEAWADTWACPDTKFSTLKCDPSTGGLWTPPEHTSGSVSVRQEHFSGGPLTQGVTGWIIISAAIWSEGVYVAGSLTTCRGVSFQTTFSGHAEIAWTANATFELGYGVSIDGGAVAVRRMNSQLTGIAAGIRLHSFTTHQATNYAPMAGGSTRVYPAIRVISGSVTINSWTTETLLSASTR